MIATGSDVYISEQVAFNSIRIEIAIDSDVDQDDDWLLLPVYWMRDLY